MKKNILIFITVITAAAIPSVGTAQITSISDNFSTDTSTFPNWRSIGSLTTSLVYENPSINDYDVNNLISSDNAPTGDGVQGDGGLELDTQDGIAGNEGIGLTLGGTMLEGEQYDLQVGIYNDNNSASSCILELYDLTAGSVLIASPIGTVRGQTDSLYVPLDMSVSYTALATDAGHQMQIRLTEQDNNVSRNVYMDNFALNVTAVPEPGGLAIFSMALGCLAIFKRRRTI